MSTILGNFIKITPDIYLRFGYKNASRDGFTVRTAETAVLVLRWFISNTGDSVKRERPAI